MLSQTPFSKPNSHSPGLFLSQPSLFGASFTSKIVLCSSPLMRSSLSILLSTRASSPSNFSIGFGVKASRTKWLSQCGQYSSDSSNSWASFRKVFLHFLQAKVCGLYQHSSDKKKRRAHHFSPLGQGMIFSLMVTIRTVKPFSTYILLKPIHCSEEGPYSMAI